MKKGVTLLELLVSMAVFSILVTSTTVILTSTLRGATQAEIAAKVRADGSYISEVLASNIRYATSISCPVASPNSVVVTQKSLVNKITYSCSGSNIASDSARINSADTVVSGCTITCPTASQVNVSFSLADPTGIINPMSFVSQIVLRNK